MTRWRGGPRPAIFLGKRGSGTEGFDSARARRPHRWASVGSDRIGEMWGRNLSSTALLDVYSLAPVLITLICKPSWVQLCRGRVVEDYVSDGSCVDTRVKNLGMVCTRRLLHPILFLLLWLCIYRQAGTVGVRPRFDFCFFPPCLALTYEEWRLWLHLPWRLWFPISKSAGVVTD
jgi:hypothetical protein